MPRPTIAFAAVLLCSSAAMLRADILPTGDTILGSATTSTFVGKTASGTLTIDGGSVLADTSGLIADGPGSTGACTVTGAGSAWNSQNHIYVGFYGAGTLTVSDSASATTKTLYAPAGSLFGNGTINASGAVLDTDLLFDATHGLTQTLPFGSGGSLNLTQTASGALGAGYKGTGSLRIADGMTLSSVAGFIGYHPSASATATVTGSGTKWTSGAYLDVGKYGTGSLTIDAGAQIATSYYAGLGRFTTGNGTARVAGASTLWSSSSYFAVGIAGAGNLTVDTGARITDSYGYIADEATSTSVATITGAGSKWSHTQTLHVGRSGNGSLTIASAGEVSTGNASYIGFNAGSIGRATVSGALSKWSIGGALFVGHTGSGTLTLESGGLVDNGGGYLGYSAGSVGNAVVRGSGTTWSNRTELMVGRYGAGTLTVADSALVTTKTLYASPVNLLGNGTITVTGGVILDADLTFDAAHGLTQTVPFGTGGTLNLTASNAGNLGAGYKSSGTLRIADGLKVASAYGYLGYHASATGAATITGVGSRWTTLGNGTLSGKLYVGYEGRGTLTVEAGAKADTSYTYFGNNTGSTGSGILRDTGSEWSAWWNVGNYGSGNVLVEGGAHALGEGRVAIYTGSAGNVMIRGAGSSWTGASTFSIGIGGAGALTVSDGGLLSNVGGYLGEVTGTGTALVTGTGSRWNNVAELLIGNDGADAGKGALTIADHAQVTARSVSVRNAQSAVRVHVSGDAMLVLGDTSNVGQIANNGAVTFYAGAFLPSGIYTPITEFASRSLIWSGAGTYQGHGGTWDNAAKTFTVAAPTPLLASATDTLSTLERLLITDPTSGHRAGASFGALPAGKTFLAEPMGSGPLSSLAARLGADADVLAAWDFTTNLSGSEVVLSFDIGPDARDLQVWRLQGSTWSPYTPGTLSYSDDGIASFPVTSFSGYAISGIVPEPATALLLLTLPLLALRRRRIASPTPIAPPGGRGGEAPAEPSRRAR